MQISEANPGCKSPISNTFDYSIIGDDTAARVKYAAATIRACRRQASASIIEIGKQLTAVRALLGHGQFIDWLEAEFDWNKRTAQRYMRVSEVFGDKSDTVSLLEPSTLYLLSSRSVPKMIVGEAVAKLESGERIDRVQLLTEIREARRVDARLTSPKKIACAQPVKLRVRPKLEPSQVLKRCLQHVMVIVESILEDDPAYCRLVFESVRQRLSEMEQEWSLAQSATAEAKATAPAIAESTVECGDGLNIPPFLKRAQVAT